MRIIENATLIETLSAETVISGFCNMTVSVKDLILLIFKIYIFVKQKKQTPTLQGAKTYINFMFKILLSNKHEKFLTNWENISF